MRSVRIEPKKAMQQKLVRVIVVLNSAHASLQRERAKPRTKCAHIQTSHIPSYLRNPVAKILCPARHNRMRILITTIHCEPRPWCDFEIDSHSAAFNLTEVLAQQQDWR